MKRNSTMWKRLLALGISTAMLTAMAGCGENAASGENAGEKTNAAAPETAAADKADADTGEVVTLKWVSVGTGMPDNYDSWKEQVNAYIEPKIGVNIEMEVVPWGDWDSRRSVLVNTNGDYDILFTNSTNYYSSVQTGAFLDLTDMLESACPKLLELIPEKYFEACKINGRIYAVPTYKDSSQSIYYVWDQELIDEYDIDPSQFKDLDEMTDALRIIRDATNEAPFIMNKNGGNTLYYTYDSLGAGLIPMGVKLDDPEAKVVSVFEQEDMMKSLKTYRLWYQEGIINADAATRPEVNGWQAFGVAQGWSGAAKTTWGPERGADCVAIQWGPSIVSNDSVRGSLNGISANCKHPEKALAFLELVNTDPHLRDMFYYGEEGVNWDYTEDNLVHVNPDIMWPMAGYTQATFFTVTQKDDVDFNQWDEVKELNENAVPSVLLGFTYDPSAVSDELANCITIYTQHKSEILTGTIDPEEGVKAMMADLRDAGFDDIIANAQEQVDAFMASKK